MNLFILLLFVGYSCCGTVTVAAHVTITHVEADLGHTMMSSDPRNNSKPVFFTSIFFRKHRLARNKNISATDKAIFIENIVTKAASCAPSCGSSVRRWVASRTKQMSALDVALFHQLQIRSIGVRCGNNGHDFRLYGVR